VDEALLELSYKVVHVILIFNPYGQITDQTVVIGVRHNSGFHSAPQRLDGTRMLMITSLTFDEAADNGGIA
jgi:hypothetical protein